MVKLRDEREHMKSSPEKKVDSVALGLRNVCVVVGGALQKQLSVMVR